MTKPRHADGPLKCPVTVEDVDLFSKGAQERWYDAYPLLHRNAPVLRIPGEGHGTGSDGFILSKYEDIAKVVRDPVRFPPTLTLGLKAIEASGLPPENMPRTNAMISSMYYLRPTDQLYRAHRQELTDPWVGPGASRHTEMITRHASALIEEWIARASEEVEFISEFARPLPQRVMASVLGFPQEDVPRLAAWGTEQVKAYVHGIGHRNELTREQLEEQFVGLDGFKEYVQETVLEKRRNPGDDMISWLCDVEYQALGRKLTDIEINGIVYAMVLGGLETTQYALEEQAQLICEYPGLFQELKADRSKIRGFCEEAMRLRSPTQGLSTRITSQDEVFQGVAVPKGSLLHLRWAAGNVDPDEWECPYELKIGRKAVTRHLAFSQGPRVCPGAGISRIEQQTAWNLLLDRFDGIEYGAGNTFEHQPGIMMGTLRLNLRFKPATA